MDEFLDDSVPVETDMVALPGDLPGEEPSDLEDLLREVEGMDLVEVLHGMSSHYHEHWSELLGWPWKRFCANWSRLVDYMAEDRAKREERERQQRLRDARALAGGMAGSVGAGLGE